MKDVKTLVRAQGLRKSYTAQSGSITALDAVDLVLSSGELAALVGPTGSGKTTLLSLLAGLETPDAGTVNLMGVDLHELGADLRSRAVGMVYQSYNLLPGFTARENVGLPLRLMLRPPFDAHQRSGQLLAELGLSELAERYPGELSAGQQQLVAIARALAAQPPVILADEPTANLDTKAARQIVGRLRRLAESGEHGVLMATHDLRTASQADRVLSLRDGRIIKETTLQPGRVSSTVLAELA